jgi:hypothetical protein
MKISKKSRSMGPRWDASMNTLTSECFHNGLRVRFIQELYQDGPNLHYLIERLRMVYSKWTPDTVEGWLNKELTEACITRLLDPRGKAKMCNLPMKMPLIYMPLYHWLRVLQGMHGSCEYLKELGKCTRYLSDLGIDAYQYRENIREQNLFWVADLIMEGGPIYDIVRLISYTVKHLHKDPNFNSVIYPHTWEPGEHRPLALGEE